LAAFIIKVKDNLYQTIQLAIKSFVILAAVTFDLPIKPANCKPATAN
jgi:hypothetical protein